MKKLLVLIAMFGFMLGVSGFVMAADQNGTVTIDEEIIVSIEPADFGVVTPGETPTDITVIDNSLSNVPVTIDSVTLQTPGTVFDSLTINDDAYTVFSTIIPAFETESVTLGITIPETATPATVNNVIMYTVTGPSPTS